MSKDVFLSVGADGSLRAFDLRALEHSTILYETPAAQAASPPMTSASQSRHQASDSTTSTTPNKPLARISFSQKEQHYLAIFGFGDTTASILDMRNPGVPVAELVGHQKGLSAVGWGCESRASHGGGGWVATCGKFGGRARALN
jgi:WD repeat-containing protein 68